MSAYVISEVEILDETAAASYRELATAAVQKYGGRYLARGAEPEVAEGTGSSRRIVIVEFPSMEVIHAWYQSPEYQLALKFRGQALDRRLMFVPGLG